MSAKLKKPTKHTKSYYDWGEVADFLEKKYKVKLRNYADRKFTGKDNDAPYQDFWHWIVDNTGFSGNGGSFTLYADTESDETWVQDIIALVFKEFGRGEAEIEFEESW